MITSRHTRHVFRRAALLLLAGLLAVSYVGAAATRPARALYHPWAYTSDSLNDKRGNHTATLLPDGRVLVAGGEDETGALATAEIFDPFTGQWTLTGSLYQSRASHTATLLADGRVLVAGGSSGGVSLGSAEIYDPATGTWIATGAMIYSRAEHCASRLPDGRVAVSGGRSGIYLTAVEFYDPATGTWSLGPELGARADHTSAVTSNGFLVIAGGTNGSTQLDTVRLINPASSSYHVLPSMNIGRSRHTITLLEDGQLFVVGGMGASGYITQTEALSSTLSVWNFRASTDPRVNHTATLLPMGYVLVVGGFNGSSRMSQADMFYPSIGDMGGWGTGGNLNTARENHTTTLLADGRVLVVGGYGGSAYLYSSEIMEFTDDNWASEPSMAEARTDHAASLLPNGHVLVAGGTDETGTYLTSGAVYDPNARTWTATGSMLGARSRHTLTLLPDGRALSVGGRNAGSSLATVTYYLWNTNMWYTADILSQARHDHTATLLPSGQVLAVGGTSYSISDSYLSSAELYDPDSDTWTDTGSLSQARTQHTATLLPDGRVLIAGGYYKAGITPNPYLQSAELYDPATATFTPTGSMKVRRARHSATLLPDGRVLVAGGVTQLTTGGSMTYTARSEIYDPTSGLWTEVGSLFSASADHAAVVPPNGKVLVIGGRNAEAVLDGAQWYDPTRYTWPWAGYPGGSPRYGHTATVLPDGGVLVVGGTDTTALDTVDRYSRNWLAVAPERHPVVTSMTYPVPVGTRLAATGTGFIGQPEGSGGNGAQDSPANYPLVQLQRIDNGLIVWLRPAHGSFSDTGYSSAPIRGLQPGHALLSVFVNGVQSVSRLTLVTPAQTLMPLVYRN